MSNTLPKAFNPEKYEKLRDLKHLFKFGIESYSDMNLYTYRNKKRSIENITYSQFGKMTESLGTGFFNLGLMGANIALLSESRWEWIAAYFAAVNGNGVVIPLDKELQETQIINFIEAAETDCIVYSNAFAEIIENYAVSGKSKIKFFINMDYTPQEAESKRNYNILSFQEVLNMGEKSLKENCRTFLDCEIDSEKMCACLFTSGTTGTSKAVKLSHRNLAFTAHGAATSVVFEKGDVIVSVLPIHHTYETTCTIFATFIIGINICFNESLKMVMKNFQLYKPTKMVLVPLFVDSIVKKIWEEIEKKGKTATVKKAIAFSNVMRKAGIDLRRKLFKDIINAFGGRVEGIICGGAPLNPDHIKTLNDFGINIWQGYGITECAPLLSVIPDGMVMKKIGSAGYPISEVTLRIDKIPGEEFGEIQANGPNVMIGYMKDEQTKEVMTDDGYFKTGDIGYLDKDGYLYITGRKKNVIILNNGKNIYPEEIEEYLQKCSKISECVVIARNKIEGDRTSEQILTAVIFPDFDKFTNANGKQTPFEEVEEDIKKEVTQINKSLPSFKHINNVVVRKEEFEKTTSKKIIRYKIK